MSPMEGETRQRWWRWWWQCSCWQERQQRLEMPCRGWLPCSRNHVFLYFIFSCCHLTWIPTDLSRCGAGKWRAGNRAHLIIFFFFTFLRKHRGSWRLRSGALTCFGGRIRSLRYIWLWLRVKKNNCGWGEEEGEESLTPTGVKGTW